MKSDPVVLTNHRRSIIKRYGRVFKVLRMDLGTESIYFFGIYKSFLPDMIRRDRCLESFWSKLKKLKLSWWID